MTLGLLRDKKIKEKGRKHENCVTCKEHPFFDLDETVFVHGEYLTKEQILNNKAIVEKLKEKLLYYQNRDWPTEDMFTDLLKEIFFVTSKTVSNKGSGGRN